MNAFEVLRDIVDYLGIIIETAIPVAFGGAILAFFFGLARFIFSAGDELKRKEGKSIMIWGLVALFVMTSVFGIIRLFQSTLETESNRPLQPPVIDITPRR